MHTLTTIDFLLRLATGVACGALIGVERQWRARMAGLRTNALVATGATLFVLYSEAVADSGSPTRVASYVVSGIGFLGGGVILRDGAGVRGLNTAATLWCSAAVGVLAASGQYAFAVLGTLAVLAVHVVLRPAGRLLDRARPPAPTRTPPCAPPSTWPANDGRSPTSAPCSSRPSPPPPSPPPACGPAADRARTPASAPPSPSAATSPSRWNRSSRGSRWNPG
nr:MgtC/SapB family protein [Kitasatospora mediocidica]